MPYGCARSGGHKDAHAQGKDNAITIKHRDSRTEQKLDDNWIGPYDQRGGVNLECSANYDRADHQ